MEEAPLKEQSKNSESKVPKNFQAHVFKKGQSGNPLGRPPGRSLKDRAKAYLAGLTDEEAVEYFEGMNKKDVWEMAEGKADTKQELEHSGNIYLGMPPEVANRVNESKPTPETE